MGITSGSDITVTKIATGIVRGEVGNNGLLEAEATALEADSYSWHVT